MPTLVRRFIPMFAAGLLALSTPAHAVAVFRVDAEIGTLEACGDDGPMNKHQSFDNSATVVFHPGSGCSQTYNHGPGHFVVSAIRFYMGGSDGLLCGYFTIAGSVAGVSAPVCAVYNTWVVAPVTSISAGQGPYTITWTGFYPEWWINAEVDYHLVVKTDP